MTTREEILKHLEHKNVRMREGAVKWLKHNNHFEDIKHALKKEKDPVVKILMALALENQKNR